jgi:hypothetical protein
MKAIALLRSVRLTSPTMTARSTTAVVVVVEDVVVAIEEAKVNLLQSTMGDG